MTTLERNKRTISYCLYQDKTEIVDEYGNSTGQYIPSYSLPTEMCANVSPARGESNTEQFGNLENYDKVIVTSWMECPIDETSVLFIDKAPEFVEIPTGMNGAVLPVPKYDYVVRSVAKSINSISIAVAKVVVS